MIYATVEVEKNIKIVTEDKMDIHEIKKNLAEINFKYQKIINNNNITDLDLKLRKLENKINEEDFWSKPQEASLFIKNYNLEKNKQTKIKNVDKKIKDLNYMLMEMPEEIKEIKNMYDELSKEYKEIEIMLLLNEKYDFNDALLEIKPGAGGVDSQDFAEMLLNMYTKYFSKNEIKYKVLELYKGDVAGIKSVVLQIEFSRAFGLLKKESGVHRLIRISPFDSGNRRHTSFASVKVSPIIKEDDFVIPKNDLKIDTFRSSGAGGQSVNTTDSAVRITHIPTKIVITCQNERSQHQNKEQALEILKSKLLFLEEQNHDDKIKKETGELKTNSFGNQKRTYTLYPYKLIKDHYSGYETANVEKVLMGNIEQLIYNNLTTNLDNKEK